MTSGTPAQVSVYVGVACKGSKTYTMLNTWLSDCIEFDANSVPSDIEIRIKPGDYEFGLRNVVVHALYLLP